METALSKFVWRIIAFITAAGFLWAATRVDIYDATSPNHLTSQMLGPGFAYLPHPWWFSVHIWLRKFYSIVAFACVGLTADKALDSSRYPQLRAAVIVALYSACIEIIQHAIDPPEPFAERILDVACGALGGWIGALVNALRNGQIRRSRS